MASTNNGGGDSLVTVSTRSSEINMGGHSTTYLMASLGFAIAVAGLFACVDRVKSSLETRVEKGDRRAIGLERSLRMWLTAASSFGIGYTWAIQQSRLTGLLKVPDEVVNSKKGQQ
jgi:hypothetical protein